MDNKNTTSSPVAQRHSTNEFAVVEISGRTAKIQCRLSNISQTGAFLEIVNATMTPRQNDIVRITVNLRQINKMHVIIGKVVWSRGLGIGVSFLKNKDLDLAAVKASAK
ncbi:MAG: PilZ domain-containing protein [Pseudobdellovibrio sp.]